MTRSSSLNRRLPTMGLHGQTSSIVFCLLRIPIPVVRRFLFVADPPRHCLSIFSSVFTGLLYPMLMLPMLLLVMWSYSSASRARITAVCISVSFLPVSLHLIEIQSDVFILLPLFSAYSSWFPQSSHFCFKYSMFFLFSEGPTFCSIQKYWYRVGQKTGLFLKVCYSRICWHRIAFHIPNCWVFYPE